MIFHGIELFNHFAMQNDCPENQLITVGLQGKSSEFYRNFFGGIRYSLVWQKILWAVLRDIYTLYGDFVHVTVGSKSKRSKSGKPPYFYFK